MINQSFVFLKSNVRKPFNLFFLQLKEKPPMLIAGNDFLKENKTCLEQLLFLKVVHGTDIAFIIVFVEKQALSHAHMK